MKSFKQGASRWGRCLLAVLALSTLGACGGGGSQIQPFAPTRVIAFGDEMSVITKQGIKYGINGVNSTTGQIDCTINPIWIQQLAAAFLLAFPQCDPSHSATPEGILYATPGAKVQDVQNAIDNHLSVNYFTSKDLVMVMIGENDVLELYKEFPAQDRASLIAQAQSRGTQLGGQINRIAQAGGKVVVSTIPDLGVTPYAIAERSAHNDIDRAQLLADLSNAFNVAMRVALINDGRMIGLVLFDETTETAARYPSVYGMTDAVDAACLLGVLPQNCTTNTLLTGATATNYMWATNTLIAPGMQTQLANLAISRAKNNPF